MMISYAQNFEDVILERLFKEKKDGLYIDVGAMDPVVDSVSYHFYKKGWRGINIEPNPSIYTTLNAARPDEINLNVGLSSKDDQLIFFRHDESGCSTFSLEYVAILEKQNFVGFKETKVDVTTLKNVCEKYVGLKEINFLKIDVEGWEREVLSGADWKKFRPTVILIESTMPNSQTPAWHDWESILLENDYLFVYFDGLNRFYLKKEAAELQKHFVYPPNIFDFFTLLRTETAEQRNTALNQQIQQLAQENRDLRLRYADILNSSSWRITAPLRKIKSLLKPILKNLKFIFGSHCSSNNR